MGCIDRFLCFLYCLLQLSFPYLWIGRVDSPKDASLKLLVESRLPFYQFIAHFESLHYHGLHVSIGKLQFLGYAIIFPAAPHVPHWLAAFRLFLAILLSLSSKSCESQLFEEGIRSAKELISEITGKSCEIDDGEYVCAYVVGVVGVFAEESESGHELW